MTTDILVHPHYTGVLENLQKITQFRIGEGERPRAGNVFLDPPYAVLYVLTGGDLDGPLSDTQADATIRFQITAVGRSEPEALAVQDICTARMKKANVTVTDRRVRRLWRSAGSNGVRRDDDLPTPLFYCYQQWDLETTPA